MKLLFVSAVARARALRKKALHLFLLLALFSGQAIQAQTQQTLLFSVQAYDKLFSQLIPGQEDVLIGDMRYKVKKLTAWRNHLDDRLNNRPVINGAFDFSSTTPWPAGVVPYVYDSSVPDSVKTLFETAIREWQINASLNFVQRSETNYLVIKFSGYQSSAIMNSWIGVRGGAQDLNVAGWGVKIDCAHELGHALGMAHEQCRSDRDNFVTIIASNMTVNPLTDVNFAIVPSSINRTTYDFDSLMHYPRNAGPMTIPGRVSLLAKAPNQIWSDGIASPEIGQKTHLSTGDKAAMAGQYGAPLKIGGRIVDAANAPLAGVQVTISGGSTYRGPNPVRTDANGNYELNGIPRNSGTYTLTPNQPGTSFTQASRTATVTTASQTTVDFTSIDSAPPDLTITTPAISGVYSTLATVTGTASDSVGLREVRVALARTSDLLWWNFPDGVWGSTTFNFTTNVLIATGTTNWSANLPTVAVGGYQVHVQSVDISDNASPWRFRHFFIDPEPPVVTVTEPANNTFIPEFTILRGTASDGAGVGISNGIVQFTLYQNGDFWTGFNWKPNTTAQDPDVLLFADVVGGVWGYNNVPVGDSERAGTYFVSVFARDNAGNTSTPVAGVTSVQFSVDNEPPSVAITSPATGSTISNLTAITGTMDDTRGVVSVRIYLLRYADNAFWDGTAWGGGGSAILPVSINTNNGTWLTTGPMPSVNTLNPANRLSNGGYDIIAFAVDAAGNQRRIDSVVTVDFHPVYLWTAGSFSDADPNNNNNRWDNPANWDLGSVPPVEATVIINGGSPDNTSMGTVTIYGVTMTGGSLATSGMLIINKLNLSGGALSGGAITLPTSSVFNWSGGAVSGICTISPGATLNLSGVAAKTLGAGAVLDNSGTVNWTGSGSIYNYGYNQGDRATISNQSGAVFNLTTDGQVFAHDYNESLFYNLPGAQLVKSGGTNVTSFNNFVLFNYGELRVDSGAILFDGTCALDTGTTLAGNGAVRLLGTSAIKCPVPGTANLRLEAGTLTASGLAAYGGSAGMDWIGGTLLGAFEIVPGSSLRISGAAPKNLGSGAVLNNRGVTTWSGPGVIYNYGYNQGDRATINNQNGAAFTILTDGQVFAHDYNSSWFHNHPGAQFRKEAATGTTLVNNFIFNNAGEIKAATGTLEFNDILNLGGGGTLTGPGQFLISSGLTTLSNLTTIAGSAVTMTAGTLLGDAPSSGGLATTGGGSFNWAGGALIGTVGIAPGAAFKISSAAQKTMGSGAVLNNAGAVTWSGAGAIYNYGYNSGDRATINNLSGATFNVTSNAVFSFVYNRSTINNASNATFAKIDGGGVTTCAWLFNNAGAVSCTSGTLAMAGGGNSSGSFDAGAGAFLRFTGGPHSLTNSTRFAGSGRVQIDGASLLLNGPLTLGLPGQPLALDLLSGVLGGNGTLPGKYVLTWTGGTIAGNQTITAEGVMIVTNSGVKSLGSGAVLNNQGSITWFGPGTIYNSGYNVEDPATINNQSNALFTVAADGQTFSHEYNPSLFNNLAGARFVKSAGTNVTAINHFLFNSPGEVRAEMGSLLFDYIVTLGPNGRLTGAGAVRLAGSATLSGTLNSTGNLRLEAGLLTGVSAATYTGGGGFDWTGGALGGGLTLAPTNGLNISGAARKDLAAGAILNNQGTITWTGPGTIYNYGYNQTDAATINNQSGARFIAATDGQVFSHDYNPSTFNNFAGARLTKSAGTNSTSINNFVFKSPGEVRVETGSMLFDGQATFGPAGSLTGGGTIRWAGDIRLSGLVNSAVNANLEGGGLTGNSNATYSGAGPLNWTAGTLAGSITLAPGSMMNLSGGGKTLASGVVFNNQGTVNWFGPGSLYNYGYNLGDRATFNNLSGGVLNLLTNGSVFSYDYSPSILNNAPGAKLRKTGGTGDSSISYTFANSGAVEVLAGTLNFAGNYASSAASSELDLVLGGLTPGTEFTRLTANGNLPLDGNLKVTLAGGFTPTNGQSFAIVGYGSHTGQFTSTQFPPLPVESKWQLTYNGNSLLLQIVPANLFQNLSLTNNGNFQFSFIGETGSASLIEASTNLVNWDPLLTNSPFNGSLNFVDPQTTQFPQRFYRVTIFP